MSHPFVAFIIQVLSAMANPEKAMGAKAYMKKQFEFLGIPMPERRSVCKAFIKQNPVNNLEDLEQVIKELWLQEEREYQYFAIELLAYHKNFWSENIISLFEHCLTHKSWWDTVDFLANGCTGPFFKLYPKKIIIITRRWNKSNNFWLQRSSLLFQLKYKGNTNVKLLSGYVINLAASKEFFVQKAIGWILREYGKTDTQWVKQFVLTNELASLSKREALKNIS